MVKYGPAGGRPCAYLRDWDSPQATTLMAQRLGPSGLRSKMASSSSTSTSTTSSTVPFKTSMRGYNFLPRIQNPETVDFGIIC